MSTAERGVETNLPGRLKAAREARGWSQERLASLSEVTPSAIDQIERGFRTPSAETLRRLVMALKVSADSLLGIPEPYYAEDSLDLRQLPQVDGYFNGVLCPVCGYMYSHWDGGHYSTREVDLAIPMSGECGHAWTLNLNWHKGTILAWVTVRQGRGHWDAEELHADCPGAPATATEHVGAFRPGGRVRHPFFGDGIVTRSDGSGDGEQVTVVFQCHGLKKLIAGYAGLVKL